MANKAAPSDLNQMMYLLPAYKTNTMNETFLRHVDDLELDWSYQTNHRTDWQTVHLASLMPLLFSFTCLLTMLSVLLEVHLIGYVAIFYFAASPSLPLFSIFLPISIAPLSTPSSLPTTSTPIPHRSYQLIILLITTDPLSSYSIEFVFFSIASLLLFLYSFINCPQLIVITLCSLLNCSSPEVS